MGFWSIIPAALSAVGSLFGGKSKPSKLAPLKPLPSPGDLAGGSLSDPNQGLMEKIYTKIKDPNAWNSAVSGISGAMSLRNQVRMMRQEKPREMSPRARGAALRAELEAAYPGANTFDLLKGGTGGGMGAANDSLSGQRAMQREMLKFERERTLMQSQAQVLSAAVPYGEKAQDSSLRRLRGLPSERYETPSTMQETRLPVDISHTLQSIEKMAREIQVLEKEGKIAEAKAKYAEIQELATVLEKGTGSIRNVGVAIGSVTNIGKILDIIRGYKSSGNMGASTGSSPYQLLPDPPKGWNSKK